MCCHDSHSTNAILSTCLAMFCTSVTFTAAAFPNYSPRHFLCTSHISSLALLSNLPLYPQIPICCTDCARFGRFVDPESECLSLLCLPFWRYTWVRLILYFPSPAQTLSNLTFFTFTCMQLERDPHAQLEHVPATEPTQYPHCKRLTLAHFRHPCWFATPTCFGTM
jgi:hypothetical protein